MFGREVKLIKAEKKNRHRRRWDRRGSFADRLLTIDTTARLSTWKQTCEPAHCLPQKAAAVSTGTNSLVAENQVGGHYNWNQPWGRLNAPQPNEPEASEYTCTEGRGGGKKDEPFQDCRSGATNANQLAPKV